MDEETPKRLEGVGGWLAFLVFGLLVFTPLRGLSACGQLSLLAKEEGTILPQLVMNIEFGKVSLQVTLAILAGLRLYKSRQLNTVPMVVMLLWIAGPVLNIADMVVVSLLLNEALWNGQRAGAMFGSLLWAGVWTAYLFRSERVRNTYRFITTKEHIAMRGAGASLPPGDP